MIVDGGGGYRVKGGGPGRMVMVKVRYNTSMHTSCNFSLVVLKPLTKQASSSCGRCKIPQTPYQILFLLILLLFKY